MFKAIITDIEGTTSSLSFVKDVLFPYAREHLPSFIRQNQDDPAVKSLLDQARIVVAKPLDLEALIEQFLVWMDRDEKITSLKALQGLIWENGYMRGDFSGHVYEDAARGLKNFKIRGLDLYIYSSGSIQAQQLLFAHTPYGDLRPLFSGYFDTNIGHKRQVESYRLISEQIHLPPHEILFLSDSKEELDASRQAGFGTYWLVRDCAIDSNAEHRQVCDFDGIQL
jgi:enolase-phosphatase E1